MYPDYLVFILDKEKLLTYDNDLKIVNYLEIDEVLEKNINYLILDGLDIKILKKYEDNLYFYYFKIILLKDIVNYIKIYEKKRIIVK